MATPGPVHFQIAVKLEHRCHIDPTVDIWVVFPPGSISPSTVGAIYDLSVSSDSTTSPSTLVV